MNLPLTFWLPWIFVIGAVVGSFLNVCIHRLPLEKSIVWPGSRCGHCLQPIRWYDNIPLLSYCWLRGRCRTCGASFSVRYFCVELVTALGFVGLYYLEVVQNVHRLDRVFLGPARYENAALTIFLYHAVLFSFLMVASVCDFEHRYIPESLTTTGTLVGLAGALLWPWPWPYAVEEGLLQPGVKVLFQPNVWFNPNFGPRQGLYPWPVWGPLPGWLAPGGNWQTGLATGLVGLLAGTLLLRAVRFFFGLGMGAEYMDEEAPEEEIHGLFARLWSWIWSVFSFCPIPARVTKPLGRLCSWVQRVGGKTLGLGDADLMMMAGSFLGWQPVLAAFFIGVFPGMILGLFQMILRGERALPFGPALAIGTVITFLTWHWVGRYFQPIFFNDVLMIGLAVLSCTFMLLGGFIIRVMRWIRGFAG